MDSLEAVFCMLCQIVFFLVPPPPKLLCIPSYALIAMPSVMLFGIGLLTAIKVKSKEFHLFR